MHDRDQEQPQILSLTPGRLRLHLPTGAADEGGQPRIEIGLSRLAGVRSAHLNPLTSNVLIHFDSRKTTPPALLAAAGRLAAEARDVRRTRHAAGEPGQVQQAVPAPGGRALLRAGLRGLLGHALVDTVFYTVAFAEPLGLPLAGLGVLHLAFDVVAWTVALEPLLEGAAAARTKSPAAATAC